MTTLTSYFEYSYNIAVNIEKDLYNTLSTISEFQSNIKELNFKLTENAFNKLSYVKNVSKILEDIQLSIHLLTKYGTGSKIPDKIISIDVVSMDECYYDYLQLLKLNTNLPNVALQFVKNYAVEYEVDNSFIKFIVNKSTLSHVASAVLLKFNPFVDSLTATDLLRIIYRYNNLELHEIGYLKLSSKIRKYVLDFINQHPNFYEDMYKYRSKWIILGEIIHPGKYKNRFRVANNLFYKLRNNLDNNFFNKRLEQAYKIGIDDTLNELTTRPGVLIRNISRLFKVFPNEYDKISGAIIQFGYLANINVLVQAINFFNNYSNQISCRYVKNKLSIQRREFNDTLFNNYHAIGNDITIALRQKIKANETHSMIDKQVYIDPKFKTITIPNNLKDISSNFNIIPRWSSIKLSDNKYLRFFVWWKNKQKNQAIDVDLSAIFIREDESIAGKLSYIDTNSPFGTFSGDITDAPNGAEEYIDIDTTQTDFRYILINVFVYHGEGFKFIPEASFGWSEIHNKEDTTIARNSFALTSDTKTMSICIIDIKDRRIHWIEASIQNTRTLTQFNTENQDRWLKLLITHMIQDNKLSLYDLLSIHANTHGIIVDDKKDANLILELPTLGLTMQDISYLLEKYYT